MENHYRQNELIFLIIILEGVLFSFYKNNIIFYSLFDKIKNKIKVD